MTSRLIVLPTVLLAAVAILAVSILESASPKFHFNGIVTKSANAGGNNLDINYALPNPGSVYPNNILWPLKAARDQFWVFITTNPTKKSEILLHLADKRLVFAKDYFESEDYETGVTALTKAEKYLERSHEEAKIAKQNGNDISTLLKTLSVASLKHREEIESLLENSPEDSHQILTESLEYPKRIFEEVKTQMLECGLPEPINPFQAN